MTPSEQCKKEGLNSFADLVVLSRVPRRTLIDWHKDQPRKFELVLKGVLYERERGEC